MSLSHRKINFGKATIHFKVLFVDRKTLEIAVHPDKSVILKAPVGTTDAAIEEKVHKRAGWIIRQLDFFGQFDPRTPAKSYISGESHLYLGKQYRLKVRPNGQNEVKLIRGYFMVSSMEYASPIQVKRLLGTWYREKANQCFHESFNRCWPKFESVSSNKPSIHLRSMKKRWGSLSKGGRLTLNTELIKAPKDCIDYVITHELCHLHYQDHGQRFYRLLEKAMPDWYKRKTKLELTLV